MTHKLLQRQFKRLLGVSDDTQLAQLLAEDYLKLNKGALFFRLVIIDAPHTQPPLCAAPSNPPSSPLCLSARPAVSLLSRPLPMPCFVAPSDTSARRLTCGDVVRVVNDSGQPRLNGSVGTLMSWLEEAGRWKIQLQNSTIFCDVKPDSLELAGCSSTGASTSVLAAAALCTNPVLLSRRSGTGPTVCLKLHVFYVFLKINAALITGAALSGGPLSAAAAPAAGIYIFGFAVD